MSQASSRPAPPWKCWHCRLEPHFLVPRGRRPWDVQVTPTSQQVTQLPRVPREMRLKGAGRLSGPRPAGPELWERMGASFRRRHQPRTRSHSGQAAPPSLLLMALCRLLSPLFCQTSSLLTPKSARDLANICQDSFPSLCVCLLSRDLGSVHRQALPLRLRGSPIVRRYSRLGVSPSAKSPASLLPT